MKSEQRMAAPRCVRCAMAIVFSLSLAAVTPARGIGGDDEVTFDFIPLTGLEGRDFRVHDMNNASQVVGTLQPNSFFRWDDGDLRIVEIPGTSASVRSINESGTVLGTRRNPDTAFFELVIWNPDAGTLDFIAPEIELDPFAMNDNLLVTGISFDQRFGFAYDAPVGELTPIGFGPPPREGVGSRGAVDVNNAGVAVGSEVILDGQVYVEKPFMWTESGGIVELPTIPDFFTGAAVAVNDFNDAAGYILDEFFAMRPAIWFGGTTLEHFNPPVNFFVAEALDINNHGHASVIAPNDLFQYTEAFVLADGAYTDLTAHAPPGLGEHAARGWAINDRGDILVEFTTGFFITAQGILRPIPNPDFDGDGDVDPADLAQLLGNWGPCFGCPEDLDGDGFVNAADLAILLGMWGPPT